MTLPEVMKSITLINNRVMIMLNSAPQECFTRGKLASGTFCGGGAGPAPANHYRSASDWLISGEWVGRLLVTPFVRTRTLSRALVLWAAEGGWRSGEQAPENTRRTTDMFTGRLLSLLALTAFLTAVWAGQQSLSPGKAALEAPAGRAELPGRCCLR